MAENAFEMPARPAKWVNVNTRHELHGESKVLCADISVRGFHLTKDEYNFIRANKHAWNCNFVEERGKPPEPMYRNQKPTQITDEYEGCDTSFGLGRSDTALEYEDAFVSKIVVEELVGGLALMDFLVSVEIEDTEDVAALNEYMGDEGKVSVFFGGKHVPKGKKAQQKLDLSVPQGQQAEGSKAEEQGGDNQPAVH